MRTRLLWGIPLLGIALLATGWAFADEEEVEVALEDVPAAVLDAVKARFPEARILEAEKETEDGETVYEVEIDDDGDELEVEVSADGKILEVEEDEDDDNDEEDDDA